MNKIYKSIYNEVLGTWVAISEVAKSGGKKSKSRMMSSVAVGLVMACAGVAGEAWGQTGPKQYKHGVDNTVTAEDEISVAGYKNSVSGKSSVVYGSFNYTNGGNSIATGYRNIVKTNYSYAAGNNNVSISQDSLALGKLNFTGNYKQFVSVLEQAGQSGRGGQFNNIRTHIPALFKKHGINFNLADKDSLKMLAAGYRNFAVNTGSLALGNDNISAGINSLTFGNESIALKKNDIAIGTGAYSGFSEFKFDYIKNASRVTLDNTQLVAKKDTAIAKGDSTGPSSQISIGDSTVAMGREVLAVGATNRAFGTNSSAVGKGNFSHGDAAQSFGNWNIAYGDNTVALGIRNDVTGVKSIAAGFENRANEEHSTAIGYKNISKAGHATTVGHENQVYAANSNALGYGNIAGLKSGINLPSHNNIALSPTEERVLTEADFSGINSSDSNYNNMVALGIENGAFGANSTALGVRNFTGGSSSVALGKSNFAKGESSQAIGDWNTAKSRRSTAMGFKNIVDTNGEFSSAIGHHNYVNNIKSHAHGGDNNIHSKYSSIFGLGNSASDVSNYSSAFGYKNEIRAKSSNVIGIQNIITGESSIALGSGNEVSGRNSISIGSGNISGSEEATNVSLKSIVSGEYAISIGHNNTINSNKTVAFGNSINSNNVQNSVILGDSSVGINAVATNSPTKVSFGGVTSGIVISNGWSGPSSESNGSVSVGAKSKERQIKHVATGEVTATSTDAINGSQLFAAIQAIGNVPIEFSGDDSTAKVDRKLGQALNIHGGAEATKLSDNNIGVRVNEENIHIKLSKEIRDITSLETEGGTKLNDNGLTVKEGPSITKDGIDANRSPIRNVGDGTAETDAANIKNVTEAVEKLKNEGYSFSGTDGTNQNYKIGETISLNTDENLATSVSAGSITYSLKKELANMTSVQIKNGPKLDSTGLVINDNLKLTSEGLRVAENITLNSAGLTAGVVSINPTTGKISGVARPEAPKDAVNLEFLNEKLGALPPGNFSFAGNNEGTQSLVLGETLTVKGNSTFESTDEGANIATKSSAGEIIIGLNKNLTGLESAKIGPNTLDATGLSVSGGPSVTKDGINANGTPIKNIGEGTDPTDAASVKNVSDAVAEAVSGLTSKGIVIGANEGAEQTIALGKKISVEGLAGFNATDLGENISTQVSEGKILIGLKKALSNIDSVAIKDGPNLDSNGLSFNNGTKYGPDQLQVGRVAIENGTISGLATPSNDDHAVNKKFVDDALIAEIGKLTDSGIKFIGNDGEEQTLALGQTIKVKGTATYSKTDAGENIATQSNNGEIIIGLKKALTNLESVTTEGGTKLSDSGLEVAGGPSVTKDGIDAKNKKIQNVEKGSGNTDAANMQNVNEAVEKAVSDLTSKGIIIGANEGTDQTIDLGGKISVEGTANYAETDAGENISTQVSAGKILVGLKKALTNIDSVAIKEGPTLNKDGLDLGNDNKVGKDSIKMGNLTLDSNGSISGVTAPTADDHAVNKKFVDDALAKAVSGLTTGGIKFVGNEGGDQTLALGDTVNIVGAETVFTNTDQGENISTKSEAGKITIGLKKNLTNLDSASIGSAVINDDGVKVGENGPSLSKDGLNANGTILSNIAEANDSSDNNDAANVKYVKDKVDELKKSGYTLTADSGGNQKFDIGSSIAFNGVENITTEVTSDGVKIKLKQDLTNMNSVVIKDGPTLNSEGLSFAGDQTKFTKDLVKVGSVQITPDGKITGLEAPKDEKDATNKGYVDSEIKSVKDSLNSLGDKPLTFAANKESAKVKLGDTISIKGADENADESEFDLTNVMTWFDTNGVLRIGVRKALKLSTIKAEDPTTNKSSELKPNSLVFNGVDGKEGKDGTVTLDVTTNGTPDVTGATTPRLRINDVDIATLNDGMKFAANAGTEQNVKLNNKVTIKGADANTNADDFDGGENIMTKVESTSEGVKFTVAFKKAPEFADLTVGGPKAGDKTPHITLKDKDNKEKFSASVDEEGNGIVSVTGSDPENKTDLMHDGLSINDADGFSKLGTNADGKGGLASPDTNKRRMTHTYNDASNNVVTEEIATLDDGLKFEANATDGNGNAKLNSKVKIAGADENKEWSEFDEGANIMTKVENTPDGETVIRVAMRKDLKLKNGSFGGDGADGLVSIKKEDGKDGITIDPSVIHFNNIPNKPDADGNPQNNGAAGITLTQNGTPDLKSSEPVTRIQITDASGNPTAEVATMNDGLRFTANVGDEKANTLNSKVSVAGHKKNTEWDKFDTGSNIMTKIDQNEDGETEITVALKRDIELSSAVIGHGEIPAADGNPAVKGKDGQITLNNKEGETAITINAGNAPATSGPSISVNKPRSDEGTKLTSDGIEISKKSPTASKPTKTLVSIAPEGSGRVQDADEVKKPRLTMTSGEGADANVEEIATMNDGLRFKGDTADLLNKPLSNILTLIGGESDAKKLTSLEDQNIGVIAEDVAPKGSRAPAEKVLTVRMSKNLKGLQSAEFKPVDESGNATGQSIRIGAGGVNIAKGDKSVQLNEDGLKVGENGPSVTNEGINAGGMSIANVGAPMQSNHAANKGYVDGELAKMQGQLGNKIQETRKDALGASAMAMATAGLPQAYQPGKSAFAVAGGVVAGQSAFAMGISSISDNGKWIIKGSVSSDSRSQVGGSIGAAYQW